jgi:hypothetical protein
MSAFATARRPLLSPSWSMVRRKPSTNPGSAHTARFATTRRGISGTHSWILVSACAPRVSSAASHHECCSACVSRVRWLSPSEDTSVFAALPKISRARSANATTSSSISFGSGWAPRLKTSMACTSSATCATAATCGLGCFMMSSSSLIMAPKRFLCSDALVDCSLCFAAARSADPGAGLSWFVVWIPAAFALRLRRASPPAEAPRCFSALSISPAQPSASGAHGRSASREPLACLKASKQAGRLSARPAAKPRARPLRARDRNETRPPERARFVGREARGCFPSERTSLALAGVPRSASPDLPLSSRDCLDFQKAA